MAKKISGSRSQPERTRLLFSHAEAKEKLQTQIDKGEKLRNQKEWSSESYSRTREDYYRWDTYNGNLLKAMFSTEEHHAQYCFGYGGAADHKSLQDAVSDLLEDIKHAISKLQNVYDAIDLIEEENSVHTKPTSSGLAPMTQGEGISKRVFIVHGHDETAKIATARLLTKLKLEPIILGEQENLGRTIIEKFESYSDVAFAVVLLTPDDIGASNKTFNEKKDDGLVHRARQNVIFEMGFFYGKLGRENVCALLKTGTERPTDIDGVVYTPMDDHGAWETKLAKEMRAAGLPVSLDDL